MSGDDVLWAAVTVGRPNRHYVFGKKQGRYPISLMIQVAAAIGKWDPLFPNE